jgi:hypothetical protein
MLKAGSIVLTVLSVFNFLLAASILVAVTVFRKNAPILFVTLDQGEIAKLDPKVLATVRALAIYFNSVAAGLSLLVLFVVWGALVKGQPWALWAVLLSAGLAQVMGFVADAAIGTRTPIPNVVLTLLLLAGLGLAGYGLLRP